MITSDPWSLRVTIYKSNFWVEVPAWVRFHKFLQCVFFPKIYQLEAKKAQGRAIYLFIPNFKRLKQGGEKFFH